MNHRRKIFLSALIMLTAIVSVGYTSFKTNSSACVKCKASSGSFVCVSAGSGGQECETSGGACAVYKPCANTNAPVGTETGIVELPLDSTFIQTVAEKHPRFAATLLLLKGRDVSEGGQVYWMPFDFTQADVDRWLQTEQSAFDFLSQMKPRTHADLPPIVYNFAVEKVAGPSLVTFTLKPVEMFKLDPAYSSLRITLEPQLGPKDTPAGWNIIDWQVN